jgi:uncharacterized protein (DUF2249 family)
MREMDEVSKHINLRCNPRVEPSETMSQPAVVHHERYEREEEKDGECVWRGERDRGRERRAIRPSNVKKHEL